MLGVEELKIFPKLPGTRYLKFKGDEHAISTG